MTPAPALSVVIADNGTPGSVDRCLEALQGQLDGVEVIVCEPGNTGAPERAGAVSRRIEVPGALVPTLWREGIRAASAPSVALTISPMLPAGNWVERLRAARQHADAVGGAIEPAAGLGLVDRAEHLCRYSRDMLPFDEHECLELPGDNAVYDRALLDAVSDSWNDGFWEPDVHRALATQGARLVHDPKVVVHMGRSAGFSSFLRQRWNHGRAHGSQRGAHLSRGANLIRIAASPLVPVVMLLRVARELGRRRKSRLSLFPLLPILASFDIAWALGEARGHMDAIRAR